MRSTLLNVHLDSWRQLGQVVAFLSVVSPTSFIRNSKLVGHPRSDFPATGIIYMPRDVSFASEAAVAQLLLSLKRMNVAAKAWPVGPRKLTASDFLRSLNVAGLDVQEASVSRFIEALTDLGLVEAEEVVADPRRFPWQRTLVALREMRSDVSAEHGRRCVEELLNRAWAQHEFGVAEIAEEVLDWLLQISDARPVSRSQDL